MSSIDLSRLPPPEYATAPEYAAIVAATLARIRELLGDQAPELELDADPAAMVVQANAWRELLEYAAVNDAARGSLLPWAKGNALDWISANRGGPARLEGESDDAYRQRVQAAARGVSVAGPADAYKALACAASELVQDCAASSPAPGSVSVDILVSPAPEALALDSLPPAKGQVTRALIEAAAAPDLYQAGVHGDLAAGSLEIEGSSLRLSRIWYDASQSAIRFYSAQAGLMAWAQPGGPGAGKYLYLHDGASGIALSIDDAIQTAMTLTWGVLPNATKAWLGAIAEGEKFLLLLAGANPAPPAPPNVGIALTARADRALRAVRAALNAESARPMGDIVTVREAARAAYQVTATIQAAAGPDPAALLAKVRTDVQAYVDSARRIGGAVRLGAIYAALYADGVTNATITSPAADIAAVAGTAPECSQVTVTLQ